MLPVSANRTRQAAAIQQQWPLMSRRERRAAAHWWWRSCARTAATWPRQWQQINNDKGVVYLHS